MTTTWRPSRFRIKLAGGETKWRMGWIGGHWAYDEGYREHFETGELQFGWFLTHRPTGYRVPGFYQSAAECRRVAGRLDALLPMARLKTIEAVRQAALSKKNLIRAAIKIEAV